jgi:hypothetical protein
VLRLSGHWDLAEATFSFVFLDLAGFFEGPFLDAA